MSQIYKLVRTVTITGTKLELDAFEKQVPVGDYAGTGGVKIHIAAVGVRQLINDAQVPEPKQVP